MEDKVDNQNCQLTNNMTGQTHEEEQTTTACTSTPAPQLSKRQQKKQEKKQRKLEFKQQRKQQEKEERAQAGETKKREISEMLEGMSEEDREAWKKQQQDRKKARYEERQQMKEKLEKALEHGLKIAIDLDFEEYMDDSVRQSFCKQIIYSYSAVRNAQNPPHLHLLSFKQKIKEYMEKSNPGYANWKAATITENNLNEYFLQEKEQKIDKNKLIYLTGDATEEMSQIERDAVYIIGGLIDSNRHKNLCKEKAEKLGIRTMALPLDKYIQFSGSKILTVNQVVEILSKFNDGKDWSTVLNEVIPSRKMTKEENFSKDNGPIAE